jgi:hypothetical protein
MLKLVDARGVPSQDEAIAAVLSHANSLQLLVLYATDLSPPQWRAVGLVADCKPRLKHVVGNACPAWKEGTADDLRVECPKLRLLPSGVSRCEEDPQHQEDPVLSELRDVGARKALTSR